MAHGDFYFTLNATFYYLSERWGEAGLVAYWRALGRDYLAPLATSFQGGGPAEVARHWSEYFHREPGGQVTVSQPDPDTVVLDVVDCPAIAWLTRSPAAASHPPVHPLYCRHCLHVTGAMLEGTAYDFALEGGGGACRQTFTRRSSGPEEVSE